MRRREFIAGLGGAAAWPLLAAAQQSAIPVVGYLGTTTVDGSNAPAFVQRLRELGWVEGRNIVIEDRWAQGWAELGTEFLTEFVLRRVDVIVTAGNQFALLAKRATSVISIVFIAGDPIGTGLVESLARPGGSITGFSTQLADTAAKRVDLLHKIVPGLRRLELRLGQGWRFAFLWGGLRGQLSPGGVLCLTASCAVHSRPTFLFNCRSNSRWLST